MAQVRKVKVIPWEGASPEGLASWGIAIDYMDGNSVAYPVGSKPQAEQEAERLRVVVERAQPVGRSICRGSDWEARNKSWQICVFFD